jgi:taurine dioxygenase
MSTAWLIASTREAVTMQPFTVEPSTQTCGALVHGVDLRQLAPGDATVVALREVWLTHQVIGFTGQQLTIEQLERAALLFGPYGEDPFVTPIPGHPHVIEIKREADERTPLFAETWHSDWSFLPTPPAGTMLYGIEIPPVGGDTRYANQYAAYDALPADRKAIVDGLTGVHSARRGYAKDGAYGTKDQGRSMTIVSSDDALATQRHPLVRTHPETGRKALFCSIGYTIALEGTMPDGSELGREAGHELLVDLYRHCAQPEFVYRHRWSPGMVTLWDNRCLLHAATGGYDGHRRLLQRITIADAHPVG